jgi:hypothetical protein
MNLETARADLAAAERALTDHSTALALAKQKCATTVAEWQRLDARIHSAERAADEQVAHRRMAEIARASEALELALKERQERIDAGQPDVLKQDQERHTRSASAMEAAAKNRQLEIAQLQGALQSLSVRGLEEERGRLQSNVYEIEQRRRELERRAKALDLLLDKLRAKREVMTQALLAPVQDRVQHYLRLLFPGATLQVGEDLVPTVLNRQPAGRVERDELDALSFGTKEQLGLISRLAYADLLRDAGKPTLVILDDALVNTDAMRLNQMKRVLYDAAERHQILLFSCHPEWWDDLGVAARELRKVSVTEVVT